MYLDSRITDQVLTVATNFGLPVLGVHDSFIVAREGQDTLSEIINIATREILDTELPVETSARTLNSVRSEGYLARLRQHQVRFS